MSSRKSFGKSFNTLAALCGLFLTAGVALASPVAYPFRVVDNSGNLVSGATVAVGSTTLTAGSPVSVPTSAGETVLSTGAAPATAPSVTLVSYGTGDYALVYDTATAGEMYFPLTVSKAGSTITAANALVALVASADPSNIGTAAAQATGAATQAASAATSSAANGTALTALSTKVGTPQQSGVAVTLPATAPTGYGGSGATGLTDAQTQQAVQEALFNAPGTVTAQTLSALAGSPTTGSAYYVLGAVNTGMAANGTAIAGVPSAIFGATLPATPAANTAGEALVAADAQGEGKWVISGSTLTLYRADGVTVARTFTLDGTPAGSAGRH